VSTSPPTTEQHEPSILRSRLADQLLAAGHVRTAAVEAAFRTVPRHAFASEVPVETAYADDIIPARHTPDGRISSSVSAPWLQADMLEAARLRPGHHVLEIGSGGYNAALIAELVGPTGSVTTVDIDAVVTDRATGCLKATGYDHVRVITADAAHLPPDAVPAASFDVVIVTVDRDVASRCAAVASRGASSLHRPWPPQAKSAAVMPSGCPGGHSTNSIR
jgi:protein-L-isoaspartate O-methyltransferase